jgi:hypothetical protein
MDECIICFEPVPLNEIKPNKCGCNYVVHSECIDKWNGNCVICNAPKSKLPRKELIPVVFVVLMVLLWFATN